MKLKYWAVLLAVLAAMIALTHGRYILLENSAHVVTLGAPTYTLFTPSPDN